MNYINNNRDLLWMISQQLPSLSLVRSWTDNRPPYIRSWTIISINTLGTYMCTPVRNLEKLLPKESESLAPIHPYCINIYIREALC